MFHSLDGDIMIVMMHTGRYYKPFAQCSLISESSSVSHSKLF